RSAASSSRAMAVYASGKRMREPAPEQIVQPVVANIAECRYIGEVRYEHIAREQIDVQPVPAIRVVPNSYKLLIRQALKQLTVLRIVIAIVERQCTEQHPYRLIPAVEQRIDCIAHLCRRNDRQISGERTRIHWMNFMAFAAHFKNEFMNLRHFVIRAEINHGLRRYEQPAFAETTRVVDHPLVHPRRRFFRNRMAALREADLVEFIAIRIVKRNM